MKIQYDVINFRKDRLVLIDQANAIIKEYQDQGFLLTLRQLYYQFVARDLIENTQRSYKRLGSVINDARMAGKISWEAIEDRTRNLQSLAHWDSPSQIVGACADQFRFDKWEDQDVRVEVWCEKEALIGVFSRICDELDVPYFACRGYVSQSEQWRAGRRFMHYHDRGQRPVVLHFGDHDPSGIDMTRDNLERLSIFAENDVEVRRLALNMDQVEEHQPPPNPAKITDARFRSYASKYGEESWELDALQPSMLVDLVRGAVENLRDQDLWDEAVSREEEARDRILAIANDMHDEEED
ncbi:MAG: hypothetical protein CL793_06295 [Chloroflexi bacterium]|nr:hypothetical protein [Chloroflexota bacterium]|tara:strand:- start:5439 stop:6329 length:891 start_codon:yes stop_codon:yes gene_type:complete